MKYVLIQGVNTVVQSLNVAACAVNFYMNRKPLQLGVLILVSLGWVLALTCLIRTSKSKG